jgi:hypothetical protein
MSTDVSFLPADAGELDEDPSSFENIDFEDLRVDFSSKEASSEAREFDALPRGFYPVYIEQVSISKCGPNAKPENRGKPFYNLQLRVDGDGDFWANNRVLFDSAMLFSGALYTITQIMKAMGIEVDEGNNRIPSPDELEGQRFIVSVAKEVDKYKMEKEGIPTSEPVFKNTVKSYWPEDADKKLATEPKKGTASGTVTSSGDSLLPS